MIGVVGGIESPGAIGIDGQAWDLSTKELIGEGFTGILVSGRELPCELCAVFYCLLSSREGGNRSVVGASEGDDKGTSARVAGTISDDVVNGDGLFFSFGESFVGVERRIKGPGAIGIDGESLNDEVVNSLGIENEILVGIFEDGAT